MPEREEIKSKNIFLKGKGINEVSRIICNRRKM